MSPRSVSIDAILDDGAIRTLFQPVVHLASGTVAGFEALTRGPEGSVLESPLALIDAARAAGRLGELDWLCRTHAMQDAADAHLPVELSWLVNVEPAGLTSACPVHLLPTLDRARAELRIILEVVERDVGDNVLDLILATDQARRDSWGVALDDVGAVEGSLALLPLMRPDVVKLDMSLIHGVPGEEVAAITAAVRSYAESMDAVILAEGIETEEHERLARVFGATYGQGYHFGRPGPLPATVPAPLHRIPLRQHLDPVDGRSPFQMLAERSQPQRARWEDLIHIVRHLEHQAAQGSHASVLLAGLGQGDYFTAATRARYDELAKSNALSVVLAEGLPRQDEPTYHVGPLRDGSRMAGEGVFVVLTPHEAAALAVHGCEGGDSAGPREFDFVYTHSRELVIDAARSFLQELAVRPEQSAALRETASMRAPRQPGPVRMLGSAGGRGRGPRLGPALAAAALDALPDATAVIDRRGAIIAVNHTWRMFAADNGGDPETTGIGVNYLQVCERAAAAGSADAESMIHALHAVLTGATLHADLEYPCPSPVAGRWFLLRIAPMVGRTAGAVVSHVNITRRKAAEQVLEHEAVHDPLTGLANRALFGRRLEQALALQPGRAPVRDVGVLYLDLDGFKTVNDDYGHDAGDELLMSAAHRLTTVVRSGDTTARLGGDEFAVLAPRTSERALAVLEERITNTLAEPYLVHGHALSVPASVGAHLASAGDEPRHTLGLADGFMYAVKANRPRRRVATVRNSQALDTHQEWPAS